MRLARICSNWILCGLAVFWLWEWANDKPFMLFPGLTHHQTPISTDKPQFVVPKYAKPNTAPNGRPWPSSAAYLDGYEQLNTDGRSSVTIDNSRNNSDVFVKLCALSSTGTYPVRLIYIPAFGKFAMGMVRVGSYDIRYRNLNDGSLARSDSFSLIETKTPDGIRYINITMTLYKVQNGNMKTHGLSEPEFGD